MFLFLYFGPETGSRRGGRGFKRFLEAVGFVLAEFGCVDRELGGNIYGFLAQFSIFNIFAEELIL